MIAFGWRVYGLGVTALDMSAWRGDFDLGQLVHKVFSARAALAYAPTKLAMYSLGPRGSDCFAVSGVTS